MRQNKLFQSKGLFIFLFVLSLLLFFITIFTAKVFGNSILIEQVLLVLSAPVADFSSGIKKSMLKYAIQTLVWISCITCVYTIFILKVKKLFVINFIKISTILQLCFTILYVNSFYQITNFLTASYTPSTFIEDNYEVNIDDIQWNKKQNLVLVIAESLESTFADSEIFETSLTPKLQKIQEENYSFKNHEQSYGTGWTIAGIASYFFGIPLKLIPYIEGNDAGESFEDFLPYATSIFKPLQDANYSIDFFSNWNSTFSGYNKLISTHTNANNYDFIYYKNNYSGYKQANWGYSDAFILEQGLEQFKNKIQNKEQPFAIIISTVDTHFPTTSADFLKLDSELANFIEEVQKIDSETTSIIIVGDHLLMQEELAGVRLATKSQRKNLTRHNYVEFAINRTIFNLFINPVKQPMQDTESRILTSVDIAPSILEAIGAELPQNQFGLGISLFSDRQTLIEKDRELYEQEMPKQSSFYNSFF